jgi:hypothetical protein
VTTSGTLVDERLRDLLDTFAAPTPSPGGSSVAALAAASAAALVERCASVTEQADAPRTCTRAAAPREELLMLADRDASAPAVLADAAGASGRAAIDASVPPAVLRAAAEEVAALAASMEHDGARAYRGEAHCARLLASAAASIAPAVIAMNLAPVGRQG